MTRKRFRQACGIIAALKKNTLADNAISTMVVINVSVPSFVFASLLQYFFAYKLGWFPILLNLKAAFMSPAQLWSMILPVLALSFGALQPSPAICARSCLKLLARNTCCLRVQRV